MKPQTASLLQGTGADLPSHHKFHIKNITHLLFERGFHQTGFKISIDAIS